MFKALVEFLVKSTSNMKVVHKILSITYRTFILPVTSGYIKRMMWYILKIKRKEINTLKEYKFEKIKPFLSYSWRWGLGIDKAFRRYYKAEIIELPVFVKVAINDSTILNEIKMAEYMKTMNNPFLVRTIKKDETFSDNMQMLSIEFVEGIHSLEIPKTENDFEQYCSEFLDILEAFKEAKIVHADIHPKNLMLNKDNHLVLLDFGISGIVGQINGVDYIARCGTYYIEKDGVRIYDDAYSFVEMIKNMRLPENWLNNPTFVAVNEKIGVNVLKVDCKNGHIIL